MSDNQKIIDLLSFPGPRYTWIPYCQYSPELIAELEADDYCWDSQPESTEHSPYINWLVLDNKKMSMYLLENKPEEK